MTVSLKYLIALWRLGRHACQHEGFFGLEPEIPRISERAADVGIFGAAVERNQSHAMRALGLIARLHALRPLAEGFAAVGTDDLDTVRHAFSVAMSVECSGARESGPNSAATSNEGGT
jgi:hypothetical protein